MIQFDDESPAFRQALLKGERLRISILLIAIGIAWIISILHQDVIRLAGGTSQKEDLTAIVIRRN
jgi:hypothetical protein